MKRKVVLKQPKIGVTKPKRRRIITRGMACKIIGVSQSTLKHKVRAGTFPQPVKLGPNAIGFFDDEIDQYLDELVDRPIQRIPWRGEHDDRAASSLASRAGSM